MASVTFIEHNGTQHSVDIVEGKSLMQLAMDNGIPGIDADCGGACACGTCHVIIDTSWIDTTGKASEDEDQMLQLSDEKTETSRLSCQITTTKVLDGMIVRLPEYQI